MPITLPPEGRDLRLDFLRGLANWAIFLDHIPDNVVNWITTRNYGFSDAAELFIFISDYTASFVYGKMMLERGMIVASTRVLRRAWQIYVAYVFLFVIYITAISYLSEKYDDPHYLEMFNIMGFINHPAETVYEGLILKFRPVNMDVLPLYIVLMVGFPLALWAVLRKPNVTLFASAALYFAARHFGWNFPAYPSGVWYFNPFAWQFLFVFGGWFALGGAPQSQRLFASRSVVALGITYLLFSLVMTVAGQFPAAAALLPSWLDNAVNPVDKTNLSPLRVLHFMVLVMLVLRVLPRDWPVSSRPSPARRSYADSSRSKCSA